MTFKSYRRSRWIGVVLATVLTVIGAWATPAHAENAIMIKPLFDGTGGIFTDGMCLGIYGPDGFDNPGTRLTQWECKQNPDHFWFIFFVGTSPTGRKLYRIENARTHMCMTIRGGSTANGTLAIQMPCRQTEDRWTAIHVGANDANDTWAFQPWSALRFGLGKCLDVKAFEDDDGAIIQQWDCNGGANQIYYSPEHLGSHL